MEMDLVNRDLDSRHWNHKVEIPLVTISCLTYNHAAFIRQCLDGFLNQVTSFEFEILIHDDCSSDGTAEIIREYEKKFPDKIFPIYQSENQYSQGRKPTWEFLAPKWRGKYIAFCEGDDYWIDPKKLQKQVDILEKNLDYIMVHSGYFSLLQDKTIQKSSTKNLKIGDIYEAYILNSFIGTLTVMIKSESLKHFMEEVGEKILEWKFGDRALYLYLASKGKIGYLDEITAVYRRHSNSLTTESNRINQLKLTLESYSIRFWFIENIRTVSEATLEKLNLDFERIRFEYNCVNKNYSSALSSFIVLRASQQTVAEDYLKLIVIRGSFYKLIGKSLQIFFFPFIKIIRKLRRFKITAEG